MGEDSAEAEEILSKERTQLDVSRIMDKLDAMEEGSPVLEVPGNFCKACLLCKMWFKKKYTDLEVEVLFCYLLPL